MTPWGLPLAPLQAGRMQGLGTLALPSPRGISRPPAAGLVAGSESHFLGKDLPRILVQMMGCASAEALLPQPSHHLSGTSRHHFSVHIYRFLPARHVFECTFGKHNHRRCEICAGEA